jgi:serine phosphatase RsbU (regulator of sigma subunit)
MQNIKLNKTLLLAFFIVLVTSVLHNISYGNSDVTDSMQINDSMNNLVSQNHSKHDTLSIIRKKADFILDIASQIVFPENELGQYYKIGIHGKSKEIKELFDTLLYNSDSLFLFERPVEVLHFRNTRAIRPVDLLYINGESKIRIRDLNKKLEGLTYFIVTENFPFGTSLLNFSLDDQSEMHFEIQDEALVEKGAVITKEILESPNRIRIEEKWGKMLEKTKQELAVEKIRSDKQEDIIEDQIEEIVKKERLISGQQTVILSSSLFIVVLTVLVLIIIKLSKQRKATLLVVKQKNKDITDSIRYAQYIQEAILPSPEKIKNAFSDSFVLYLPKDIISGDFYWFKETEHIKMLSVADCTGHGVPGAFLSIMGNELLSFFADSSNFLDPSQLLQSIDQRIAQSLNQEDNRGADGMDMALISYNSKNGLLKYAGAYRPLIMVRNNELSVLKPTRISLGGFNNKQAKSFASTEFKALPGDCYYMFSDGYPDQFGGQKRKKYMTRRFYNLIRDVHHLPMDKQKERLLQAHLEWKGSEEQVDDISVVGIRI